VILIPFFWTLSTSLRTEENVFRLPVQWIPNPIAWGNYAEVWRIIDVFLFFKNTCIITFSCIIGGVLSASLVGFGFARLDRAKGAKVLFLVLLSTMMLPGQVTMIPVYLFFNKLRWIGTFLPLIVPSFFGGGAFAIFLCRQFFRTIPRELDDAARIDGCSTFGIYRRILLPLSKPVLMVLATFSFIGHWNDFMGPLIYLSNPKTFTLAVGLTFFSDMYTTYWHLLMAATILMLIPPMVIFFFAQKVFLRGMVINAGIQG